MREQLDHLVEIALHRNTTIQVVPHDSPCTAGLMGSFVIAEFPDLSKADWRKSRRSGDSGGNCVEVATNLPDVVAVRDSKDPTGPALIFTPAEWDAFLLGIKDGGFGR